MRPKTYLLIFAVILILLWTFDLFTAKTMDVPQFGLILLSGTIVSVLAVKRR